MKQGTLGGSTLRGSVRGTVGEDGLVRAYDTLGVRFGRRGGIEHLLEVSLPESPRLASGPRDDDSAIADGVSSEVA